MTNSHGDCLHGNRGPVADTAAVSSLSYDLTWTPGAILDKHGTEPRQLQAVMADIVRALRVTLRLLSLAVWKTCSDFHLRKGIPEGKFDFFYSFDVFCIG